MSDFKLVGKDEAYSFVNSSIKQNKLSHALLICGDKGIGKKFFATEIAKMLVCEGEESPCNECNACKKIQKQIHPDIVKIFPSGKSQTIGIKDIEPVKKSAYVKPNDADCKVFIIVNAEKMNRFAQNALLKMIEEPPSDCYFLLTCENSSALLPTVRSRVTEIRLSAAELDEVRAELKERFFDVDNDKILKACEISYGNIGLAIELLENEDTEKIYDDVSLIARAACDKDRAKLCLLFLKYTTKKDEALRLVRLLKLVFRDVCAKKAGEENFLSGLYDDVKFLSNYVSTKGALDIIEACEEFEAMVLGNSYLSLSLTALEIKITNIIKR